MLRKLRCKLLGHPPPFPAYTHGVDPPAVYVCPRCKQVTAIGRLREKG